MTIQGLAGLIPEVYRAEILQLNMINEATATASSAPMCYLFTVWRNYVEASADLKMECGLCLERILRSYRALQPVLVEMEQNSRLLDKL